jgi:ABC-2 type transport system permease protein/sodium transport system permease protein
MSQTDPARGAARAAPPDSVSRVARLTLKELRETLRDRRTILTLVLMPLLVYPLLSLAFKQFLLSSFQQGGQDQWRIGVASEAEWRSLERVLQRGHEELLKQEQDAAAPTGAAALPRGPSPDIAGRELYEPQPQDLAAFNPDDLVQAVRQSSVDLGVRLRLRGAAGTAPLRATDDTVWAEYDLIYRANSPLSRQVAEYVERRLRAYNDRNVQDRLQALRQSPELPATWQRQPIAEEEGESYWLATVVPMVLILMTITGAVYPAIDLTAGERERGTLEALMAAPVPRLGLLFAKYVAVLTVAMLTALMNILGMTVTVLSTGLGPLLFGERDVSLAAIVVVFGLLVLFAAFFSAVLLCVTSFARSFKEAQAYLIPLMLLSLGPGLVSVVPGLELNAWLSVTPLVNIVLLARDVLAGDVHPLWSFVAVATTCLYAAAALGLAARIFGSDSILYGSQSSWNDLFRRPQSPRRQPTLAGAMLGLALIAPLYVVASGTLAQLSAMSMARQLLAGSAMLVVLFAAVPLVLARWQGVAIASGFQLRGAPLVAFVGAVILGCSLAPLALELILLSQQLGIATITDEQLAAKAPLVQRLVEQWRQLSPALVLAAIAVVPAVVEELFFRGYLLGSMRGRLPAWLAITFTALAFGLFHASVGGLVALERVLSSTFLGLVLGWVCWTSRSVLPGMIVHALNNALVVSLAYGGDGFKQLGWDVADQRHLPAAWLTAAAAAALVGAALVYLGRQPATIPPLPASPLAAGTPPP